MKFKIFLSSIWYLIKQLFYSRFLDISLYDSQLGAPHLVHYVKAYI